jgi:hypothetical protein
VGISTAPVTGLGIVNYPLPKTFGYPIQKVETPPNPITIYPGTLDLAGIIADARRPLTSEEVAQLQKFV